MPDGVRSYTTTRRGGQDAKLQVRYQIGEPMGACEPGGLEHFLLERYLFFSEHRGSLQCGQVHHPPYPVQRAELLLCEENIVAASGLARSEAPSHVQFAAGVDVEVFALANVE